MTIPDVTADWCPACRSIVRYVRLYLDRDHGGHLCADPWHGADGAPAACSHIPELIAARGLCVDLSAENDRLRDALVGLTMAVEQGGPHAAALRAARAALGLTAEVSR